MLSVSVVKTYHRYQEDRSNYLSDEMINNYHTVVTCFVYWYRSAFMHDVIERKVLHNTFLHSAFIGRTMAAIGEVVFMRQLLILHAKKQVAEYGEVCDYLLYAIWLAECLCFTAVFTKNQFFHFCENTTWTIVYSVLVPFLLQKKMYGELGLVLLYLFYMVTVDLPFYMNAWKKGECGKVIPFWEGAQNSLTHWSVCKEDKFWVRHMEYMTLNFNVVPLYSLHFVEFI